MTISPLVRALFFLALAVLISSCTKTPRDSASLAVVVVNGDPYKVSDFANDIGRKLKSFDALAAKDPMNVKRVKENVIREFIISTLLSQYAGQHKIEVSQADIDQEFDRIRKTYPDDLTFKSGLASEGLTIETWRQSLKKTILERKVFGVMDGNAGAKDDGEARKYYEAHKQEFEHGPQVHIEQIVVSKEDDAERLLHKIKSGGTFSDLAKKFSVSPDGATGGDVGFVGKGSVPAFDVAFNMRPGQISGIIKSSYGFHIIKVLDKRPQGFVDFEKAKAGILHRLATERQQKIFAAWLDGAIKEAHVERNDALVDKVRVRTEGDKE